jgi:hypothetical protein
MQRRHWFGELPLPVQAQLAGIGPFLFGAVVGLMLGESAAGYWALTALSVGGGIAGGFERAAPRSGAARGVLAGTSFGTGIVLAHAVSGDKALATVPSPLVLLILFAAVGGVALGMLGATLRSRVERGRRRPG